jgi:ATP-dependent DNA helicase RecG
MENPFSRLLKVLSLERKQGYRNKAVIGGLDKFASRWEADARATSGSPVLIGEIVALLIGYPSVEDPGARERIIDQIVRRTKEAEASLGEATPEEPARPAEPAPRPTRPGMGAEGAPAANRPAGAALERPAAPAPDRSQPAVPLAAPTPPASRPGSGDRGRGAQAEKPGARPPAAENEAQSRDTGPTRSKPASLKPDRSAPKAGPSQPAENAPEPAVAPSGAELTGALMPGEPVQEAGEPAYEAPPALPATELPAGPDSAPAVDDSLDGWVGGPWQTPRPRPAPAATHAPILPPPGSPAHQQRTAPNNEPPYDAGFDDAGDWPEEEPDLAGMSESSGTPHTHEHTAWQPPAGAQGRELDAPVTRVPSVGPSFAEKLAKLNVYTIRDLLYLLPRRYEDYSQLRTIDQLRYGLEVTIVGTVWQIGSRSLGEGRKLVTATVGDGTGEIQMSWFNPFVERQLRVGRAFIFSGKIDSFRGSLQMRDAIFEPLEGLQLNTGRLIPVYPLTQGLTSRGLRKVLRSALTGWAGSVPDLVPSDIRQELGLMPLAQALEQVHLPENAESLAAARRRLSFDEFFYLQLGVLGYRQRFRSSDARPLPAGEELAVPFVAALPFAMTGAQQRVLGEIAGDLAAPQPMSRLLQGDVGSGKTAVAAAALWVAVANGTQGAIMAPTEILAEQHARSFARLFAGLTRPGTDQLVQIALLTGRQKRAEREAVLAGLAAGEIDIAVGTHALIQEDVAFRELTVAVVDEQHRFGVEQRAALRQKGNRPHMLVMSATPIPRSLALTLYGDLDVSVIDEMPAGRTPIKTKWLTSSYRERAYNFIRRQVAEGRQAFIIYPLVEESERSEAKAAVEEHARLQSQVFPNFSLGLLHGRMKGDEKDAVMRAYAAGELQVLVATSVVEVGIDVPNATTIVIEGAERFGLAQLHQFRGRVGRGEHQSYCILISDAAEGESAQRLQALETNTDGFALAQIDLELRGPGDFLGTRQSGLPPLQTAQLSDLRTLEDARCAAQKLFAADPLLVQPEHRALAERVAEFWQGAGDVS